MEKNSEKKKKAKTVMPVILGAVLLAGAAIGTCALLHSHAFITTDDAQIDANVVPIAARVSGAVQTIRFAENQYVRAGDTLCLLEDSDYRIKLEQAEAALDAARLNTNISKENALSSKANITSAEGTIASARVRLWKATEDYERYKLLMANQATSQERLDAAKAEKEAAEAQLSTVQSQLTGITKLTDVAEKQIDGATIAIRQKMVDVEYARLLLSYTVITAPASGIVSKRSVQIGQLVQPGTPVCAVVTIDSMYVTANFKETQMRRLRAGQIVEVTVDAFPDRPLTGSVASFCGATGAKFSLLPPDNATGNFVKVVQRIPVRISLDTLGTLKNLLRPGMSITAAVRAK